MKKELMKGSHALVHASIEAGCTFFAGYPITPQNEIPELMSKLMPKSNGTFIQAESEVSSINMIFGAASTGARSMTSSSSPGVSLMQEGISYIAAAELPCVIVNMVRAGPGLGNLRASQADLFQSVKGGGHGDYRLIVLAPSTNQEIYDLTMAAFDYADHHKNPVLILGDGIISQMIEPVELKKYKPILPLPSKDDWALTGCKDRQRHLVKTTRLDPPDLLVKHNLHLKKKYKKISDELTLFKEFETEDAEIIIVAYGITARVAQETVHLARKEGMKVGSIQLITLWPFPNKILKKYRGRDFLVVEMSNGQLIEDVKLALGCKGRILHFGYGGGWYPDTDQILTKLRNMKK